MQIQIITVDSAKNTNLAVHQRQAGQGPIKHAVQAGQKVTLVVDGVTLTGSQTVVQQKLRLVKNGNNLIVETADGSEKLVELDNFANATDAILYGDQWVFAQDLPLQAMADGVTYTAVLSSTSVASVVGASVAGATTGAMAGAVSTLPSVLGGVVLIGAAVAATNKSEPDRTAPPAPTGIIIRDTDGDGLPTISGTTEPGATVTIVDPEGRTHTVLAHATTGAYSLELTSAPTPLTGNYVVTAADAAGNTSLPTTVATTDLFVAAPTATVRDTDGDGIPTISGAAEAGSIVTIVDPEGRTHTVLANATTGAYSLELASAPTPLTGNYVVTSTDAAGNTSEPTTVATTDLTAPAAPYVDAVADTDGDGLPSIIGTAEPGETVTIVDPQGRVFTVVVDGAGEFNLELPTAPTPLTGDYVVTATDAAGNTSLPVIITKTDLTAPAAPTVIVRDTDGDGIPTISGIAEPGSSMVIVDPQYRHNFVTADAFTGAYSLELASAPTPLTGNYVVTARDSANNTSLPTTAVMTDLTAPDAPTVDFIIDIEGNGLPTISGTAEPETTVTIVDPEGTSHTVAPDGSGHYSLMLNPAPSPLIGDYVVTATDAADNTSLPTIVNATDLTAPAAPVVDFILDTDGDGLPTISGTTEPDATVTIIDPEGNSHTGTADRNGDYRVDLWMASTPLTGDYVVTATDAAGNTSLSTTVNATDLFVAAPTATVRDTDGNGLPTINGTTERAATVIIVDPEGNSHTVTASGRGHYTLELSTVPTPLIGNYVVTATDMAGNTSLPTTVATKDLTAPNAPSVTYIRDDDGNGLPTIKGTTEPGATVTIVDPEGRSTRVTADHNGSFSLRLTTAPTPLTGDYVLTATDVLGNTSSPTTVTTTDLTAPDAPVVNFIRDTDGNGLPTISGIAEPGALVSIVDSMSRYHEVIANPITGAYSLELNPAPSPLTGDYVLKARDAEGNVSLPTTVTATDLTAPAAPAVSFIRDTDGDGLPTVSGTAEPGSIMTIVDPEGRSHSVTAVGNGDYSLELATAPTPLIGDYEVTATDLAGNTSLPTTVSTTDLTAPAIPTVIATRTNIMKTVLSGTAVLNAGETLTVTFDGATYYNVNVMAGAWQIDTNSVVPSSGSLTGGFTNGLSYGVVARVDDAAGNSVFDSSIDEVFYETTPPTVQIFGDGSTGVITFNFSEAPVNFDASDISVVNGTKGALTMVNATTYELAVTPAFAETATNIAITVGAGTFRDEAGNWNSAAAKNATTIANSFQSPTFATNITNLDVSHAISAESAFANNNTFNQDIGGWDISSLTDASGFLDGAVGMAVANLDKLLAGWSDLNLSSGETAIQNNVALGLSGKTYTDAASAQYLIDNYGWTLTGSIAAGTVVGGNTIDDSFNQNAAVSGTVMHGLGGNDYLAGSDHADTIVGGAGDDILRGNGGSDTFRYHFTNEGVDTILDFDLTQAPSAGGDVLNVHYLLDGATNLNIGDFIQLVDNGGNVLRFDIDADGNASGADVSIIFDNIAFSDVTGPHLAFLQDMITQQNLVI